MLDGDEYTFEEFWRDLLAKIEEEKLENQQASSSKSMRME